MDAQKKKKENTTTVKSTTDVDATFRFQPSVRRNTANILKFINAPVPIVMALSRTSLSLYCGNLVYYKSLVYADRATLRTTVYDNRNRIYRAA